MTTLNGFFEPKSIAVIGASRTPGKIGYTILENLKISFPEKIYPINPNTSEILGLDAYSSVLEVEDPIDLAVIVVPAEIVDTVLKECVKKKIKSVIIISSGFSEIGEKERELDLKNIIKGKTRVIGPNCVGIYKKGLDMLFFPRKRLKRPVEGSISFITQSGAFGSTLLDLISEEGVGISKFISIGNKLDVDEIELLSFLGKDLATRCIAMYIESINNGKEFLNIATKVKKPIVVLKAGKTEKGKEAVSSHTGALAGKHEIYSAAFKKAGILEANTTEELFDFSKALANQPILKNKKIAILTNGGGYGIVAADTVIMNGLELAELSKETIKELKSFLPSYAIIDNPVDLTGDATSERYQLALDALLKDKEVAGIICIALLQVPTITDDIIDVLRDTKIHGKPVVVCATGGAYTMERSRKLENFGIPVYSTPERAVGAIAALYKYNEMKKRLNK